MNGLEARKNRCPAELRVLTFCLMDVRIGVDADQIAEVLDVAEAEERGMSLIRFDEKMTFGGKPVIYNDPKAIVIKQTDKSHAVVIDAPDDIVSVNVHSIQPLPPLISLSGAACAFWGATAGNNGIVFLFDFNRLKN